MTLPWHRGYQVDEHGVGFHHGGLYEIWKEEEHNGRFIQELDFGRQEQELAVVLNSRNRASSKGYSYHGSGSRHRSSSRYEHEKY